MRIFYTTRLRWVIFLLVFSLSSHAELPKEKEQEKNCAEHKVSFQSWVADHPPLNRFTPDTLKKFQFNCDVLESKKNQPEFSTPTWLYLDGRLTKKRIQEGLGKTKEFSNDLAQIERDYSIDSSYLVAIWGLESSYGSNLGSHAVINSMATLSYLYPKSRWPKRLLAAIRMIEHLRIDAFSLKGSWAGAIGHTQVMPTTYMEQVKKSTYRRKGEIRKSPADALAMAAQILTSRGWKSGEPWGIQVQLSPDFSPLNSIARKKHTVSWWQKNGVQIDSSVPTDLEGRILMPMGLEGPAFLTFQNFDVIKRYNNSNSYALSVALLAERLRGLSPRALTWPKTLRTLTRSERINFQEHLNRAGYDVGVADGLIGPATKRQILKFHQELLSNSSMIPRNQLPRAVVDSLDTKTVDGQPYEELLFVLRAMAQTPLGYKDRPLSFLERKELQNRLNQKGIPVGVADGYFGANTLKAIQAYIKGYWKKGSASPSFRAILEKLRSTD